MTLGERLTCLRKQKNLSQEEVANQLNVSRQTVSKWELDQSLPDFDKIMPICNLYEISSEELLTGTKNTKEETIIEETESEKRKQRKRASGIVTSVLSFFMAIVWIMTSIAAFKIHPVVGAGIFLLICGISTCMIIYTQMVYKRATTPKERKQNKLYKMIHEIASITTLIIYLVISFITHAWHITWIVWIIFALFMKIVKLILSLRGEEIDE